MGAGLVLTVAALGAAYVRSEMQLASQPLPVMGKISDFHLTNQNDRAVSLSDLRGKIWVANIIFTRCPGPCRTMTARMEELQKDFEADSAVKLVTLTSDPENDTPAALKKFAAQFQADPARWEFLTGNRAELRSLAVNDFKFTVVDKPPGDRAVPEDLFIHSTWFALVDRDGNVRGWLDKDGNQRAIFESDEPAALVRLRAAIRQLLREPVT